jgi:hypothetical protein
MSASSHWNISETDFPANGTPRQKLGYALKYAMLAPTEMNWPPWEFRLADEHLDLFARKEGDLEGIDPEGRDLMISCGAALLYLKLALKHFGCLGRVELFPDLGQPTLAARIHHGFGRERDAQERLLFEAMVQPHATGLPRGNSAVSESNLTALSGAIAGERGWVEFARGERIRQRLMGLPSPRPGARWAEPLPTFAVGRNHLQNGAAPTGPPPIPMTPLAVVKTKTDDKHGWLAAGHAMARVILLAQACGMSWSFFNQAVRRREAREALRLGIGHKGFAQVILRFESQPTGLTVRRTVPQTLTATAS